MSGVIRRSFECIVTGDLCSRSDCSKKLCQRQKAESAAKRLQAEARQFEEAGLLARQIEQVAKDWLPIVAKGQKITAQNKGPALKKLAQHPKVIAEAKKRRAAILKAIGR
jgi:hypothetical protein